MDDSIQQYKNLTDKNCNQTVNETLYELKTLFVKTGFLQT